MWLHSNQQKDSGLVCSHKGADEGTGYMWGLGNSCLLMPGKALELGSPELTTQADVTCHTSSERALVFLSFILQNGVDDYSK